MQAYRGDIVFTKDKERFTIYDDSYILVEDGKVRGIVKEAPACPIVDYAGKLIIPAFSDVHLHAPQHPNEGLGYDEELLPWLNKYTFPTEAKYKDATFARFVYNDFVKNLWKNGITRSVVFATLHEEATEILFDCFEKSGLYAYIGKVNMDRNASADLSESSEESLAVTRRILARHRASARVHPIITPRFVPSCSDVLMEALQALIQETHVPVQSHLSENRREIAWVGELHPECPSYTAVYDRYDMLGTTPTIMAHCIHCTEEEKVLLKKGGVMVAHCPTSNLNLMSGLAPIRDYLDRGISVGLGSDVSGGHTLNMFAIIVSAIQVSKMYTLYVDASKPPLKSQEAFYLATKGGGGFFGKVGSFEEGYDFDALVVDIDPHLSTEDRIERLLYQGDDRNILERFAGGRKLPPPDFTASTGRPRTDY